MIAIEPANRVNAAMLEVGSSSGAAIVPPPGPQPLDAKTSEANLPPVLVDEAEALVLVLLPPPLVELALVLDEQPDAPLE